ncbi:hypothetical protein TanjilG_30597 [Lupinus angustifolius]|uniref:LNS2/PITP domain-containing protein n=1 Tax=Lupinus angustifolius TaxID=3871 RepID=A0A4P1RNS9_LUPAN|nr:PREDICTED: phosphatidate phosphatase PAH2-like isoform X1 [Lupinus angustifolius]XP_019437943.1 PREDICTED: phosphatidate phosphatase PAH2-like isoform X2 [Lupinus angustifolius]XP_019437944.1 PREDICTED: phosphatidate phosphatase PAH2-like isoform X3 [Lupinus angustifolius]XP_019437945.1 PREDICTED: phosphatidate phosphatase PAH2-like isoform X1 [Lupinus angustifolius]XP_019437946.1 PREDICTED: phosphatidate phosphatase PAH2-like isoform X1 [Lupinus angustifolius]XP_019437947.1 PREDICTED: phos
MQGAVGRLGSFISQGVYTVTGPLHPFGGAVDIVVVEQPDGSFKSSPWYVRFGKFQGVLKAREKVVDINVNGVNADFNMYLDGKGEAFFLREIDHDNGEFYSGYETDDNISNNSNNSNNNDTVKSLKSKSCNFDSENDGNKIVVGRRGSRRARLLGLMFGRKSLKGTVEEGEEEERVEDGDGKTVDSIENAEVAANLLELKWSTNLSGDQTTPKQAHDLLYLAGECGEVNVHDQVLHSKTALLPDGTEIEEVTNNVDLGMPVMEVSEFHSGAQGTSCSNSFVSTCDVTDGEELQTSPKFQTVNMGLGRCSSEEVESNFVTKPSGSSSPDNQTLDENDRKDKDLSSTLSSPVESLGDCLPGKSTTRSPSASSEEENFLFSDLDESRTNDQLAGSISPEYIDKEDHLSNENGTEKVDHLGYAICNLHSSLENSTTVNQTSDLEELGVISSPIVIPRNEAAKEEAGQHTGSLPNFSSHSDSMRQACFPLSQSLNSRSTSLLWTFPGKDNLEYLKSDESKENELLHEEPGANDYHSSGELNNTVLNVPLGDPSTLNPSPSGNWRVWPFSLRRSGSKSPLPPTPSDAKNTTFTNSPENTIREDADKNELKPNFMKKKVRENTPTSEQVSLLNLKEGRNTVIFTFSTAMLGKQQVDARIFLWKWNTRVVISDVDGTITRSDVLGQFMPLVGVDWSQTGVAHLFSAIKENGYQLLFLSARSISQAYITRQFLVNLKQDGKVLPDGPVVISPDGLFPSLYREVIRRVPHEFKIACLEGIKTLFPSDCSPFYAGFGNRDTDEISYLKVGIPRGKIFIINPKGEVAVNRLLDTRSYTSLHALVNGMFPSTNSSEQEDFNSWNFWKLPPPLVD